MEKRLENIERKIDSVIEVNNQQNVTLAKLEQILEVNTDILDEHQKRTTLSEERLHTFEIKFERHIASLKGAAWVIGCIFALAKSAPFIIEYFTR